MLQGIHASLERGGFTVTQDSVAGRRATIGRSARLRLGPRRHLFVLVVVFKAGMAGREHLDRYLDEAGQYAATVKTGRASGATAVAVAVIETIADTDSVEWALVPPFRPPAGRSLAFPVLVELMAGRVTCPEAPADLCRVVGEHVRPSMRLV